MTKRLIWQWLPLILPVTSTALAGDVRGTVVMSSYCSPETSPAAVWLEPIEPAKDRAGSVESPNSPEKPAGEMVLVRQSALQFVPRVVVLKKGQSIRFTNEDSEFHNINVQARGELFNQTMPPGQPAVFEPNGTGILKVFCNVHQHMRAFLIVQDTPWAMTCSPKGKFRFENVPAGRYRLTFWHEMGRKPTVQEILVPEEGLDLGTTTLADATAPPSRRSLLAPKATSWPDVIDRISVKLSSSVEAAKSADETARALSLAASVFEDDYDRSGLRLAVRTHLGPNRAEELDAKFIEFRTAVQAASNQGGPGPIPAASALRSLLASLIHASEDLKSKGINAIPNTSMPK